MATRITDALSTHVAESIREIGLTGPSFDEIEDEGYRRVAVALVEGRNPADIKFGPFMDPVTVLGAVMYDGEGRELLFAPMSTERRLGRGDVLTIREGALALEVRGEE